MNITQITETLEKIYREEGGRRIVFWNDADGEFTENLSTLVPEEVEVLRPDLVGALAAKIRLEIEAPEQKFLVYSPSPKPESEDDWLLDIRLYSEPPFTADAASLLFNVLHETTIQKRFCFSATRRCQQTKPAPRIETKFYLFFTKSALVKKILNIGGGIG